MNLKELQAQLAARDPVALGHLPTPLHALPRFSAALGREVWVKRDDQTGLATGGNKTRKLRFLIADALQHDAGRVITAGAQQSNHARQTAAAAAKYGLDCTLVLHGKEPELAQGNYLLDKIVGADIHWAGDADLIAAMDSHAAFLREQEKAPYVIPYGGSNAVGICGYVEAFAELWEQCQEHNLSFDHIIVASSSGGTQAGLALAAKTLGYTGKITGISIAEPASPFRHYVAGLANETAHLLDSDTDLSAADIHVDDRFLGGGYGVVSDLERDAISLLGRTEGLLVDPVYTGRALGGLITMVHEGTIQPESKVLFWHTGGVPALFAYAEDLAL